MLKTDYRYKAFGLEICSYLPLPELLPGRVDRPADVRICSANLSQPPADEVVDGRYAAHTGEEAHLYWETVGMFAVQNGRRILVDPAPDLPKGVLQQFLLGSVFSILLHQRGYLVLHASAVAINNAVVAFVGHKGFGKSTTAAALHARGHTLLTDDVVAIDLDNGAAPMVVPGFPQFKLWPESASFLGVAPEQLNKLVDVPEVEKRGRPIECGFADRSLPLQAIFLLAGGDWVQIEPVTAQQAFLELMPHWQTARQGLQFARVVGSAEFFQKTTMLLSKVPVYRLSRPFNLSLLPEVVKRVEAHIADAAPSISSR